MVVSNISYFHPLFGEDFQFDEHIFQMGGFKDLTIFEVCFECPILLEKVTPF